VATATTSTPLVAGRTEVEGSVAIDVVNQADLQLIKTAESTTVNAGASIGYTLTVVNAGPSDVRHAVVSDALPDGFTIDPTLSDCPDPQTTPVDETQAQPWVTPGSGTVVACRVGALAAGTSASVRIVADTNYLVSTGLITNQAMVGSLSPDPDWSNNAATADVTVTRLTDLAISVAVSTTTPTAGQDITFTGFVANNGPSAALNTTGDTVFPVGFVPVSVDVPFNDCTWTPAAPSDPYAAAWQDVSYSLHCVPQFPGVGWEPGGSATNLVVMHIPGDTPAGAYSGTSTVTTDTPETTLTNNTVTLHLVVQHVSDTQVVKTLVSPDPMVAGQPATWRLTASNAGPSVADNLVISDAVPAGMTYVSAQVEGGAACPAPGIEAGQEVVRCPVGQVDIGPANTVSVLVTFAVDSTTAGQNLCNTAIVGSGSLDPDASNNQSAACGVAVAAAATGPGNETINAGTGGSLAPTGPWLIGLVSAAALLGGLAGAIGLARRARPAPRSACCQ